nr:hypothetical protein [Tanacetum cinerariifolium]
IIRKQVDDLSTHTTKYALPTLSQKVFANMKRVGKGFSGVDTPLFEGMLVAQEIEEEGDADEHVVDVTAVDDAHGDDIAAHGEVPTVTQEPSIPSLTPYSTTTTTSRSTFNILALDACATLTKRVEHLEYDKEEDKKVEEAKVVESAQVQGRQAESQAKIYKIDIEHANKVLSMQEDKTEPAKVKEVVDVVTNAKLIIEVVTAPPVLAATLSAAPARVVAAPSRRTKGVLILLVERRYPLSRFTLDQMLNAVRLRVEEESEMSLELLRFTSQQHQEGQLE